MKGMRVLALAVLAAPTAAWATAGYFQHGYGLKAKSMGGVGIALPQDSLAAATNPAGMAWVGSRLDLGIEMFVAKLGSEIVGNTIGMDGSREAGGTFLVPELGFNRMLDASRSVGVSVYGNGGRTEYNDNPFIAMGMGGSNPLGLDFQQALIAPTFATKLGEQHSIGVSLILAYQTFAASGLERFDTAAFSSSPGSVTNRGHDHATGVGLRLGWTGQITPGVTLGATYKPKIRMSKFDRYKGLLADQGGFDIPADYGIGIAAKAMPRLTVAADIQRIDFAKVGSLGNRADCFLASTCRLGTDGGPGSGWRNTTVYKLGVAWEATPAVTLRAGFAKLRQPIPADQTLLNILSPAVVENHLTLGGTWQVSPQSELTVFYMHAYGNTVHGSGSIPGSCSACAAVGGGEANLRMKQDALGVEYGWRM